MFSRQWEAARDEARDLDKYRPNWDGADADPVPLELIHESIEIFRSLEAKGFPAPDNIYPAADGSVCFEWHHEGGFAHLVNLRRSGRMSVVTMMPDGTIRPPSELPSDQPEPKDGPTVADGDAFEFSLAA
jgi:hypothetical protein